MKNWAQFQARLVRRALRRSRQMLRYRRLSLARLPILFANSFPKSGTHLLTQILDGFTRIGPAVNSGLPAVTTFVGESGRQRSEDEILGDLRRFLPGDIGYGHIHALPGAVKFFNQGDDIARHRFAAYFILRDPRDVVVSHIHYVAEMKTDHVHHYYFNDVLQTPEEQLRASIQGIPEGMEINGRPIAPLPDIRQRFEPFLGWLDQPSVKTLRYEDFITERPGALAQVLDHAIQRGFEVMVERKTALNILEESINPQKSPTFRSGKVGGWRNSFSEEQCRLFKDVTGDLLVRLGYEKDQNW